MRHLIFIDPLEKLNIKKDSSLLLAHTFKELGKEVYIVFEKDFYLLDSELPALEVYPFASELKKNSFYLSDFKLKPKSLLKLKKGDVIHMRIDPPYDGRYQRYLWMLEYLESFGIRIINNPKGIMLHNEKLHAFKQKQSQIGSFVGLSLKGFESYLLTVKDRLYKEIIMKPLDGFSGIGVEKFDVSHKDLKEIFKRKIKESDGPIIVQPFIDKVYQGEQRALYYAGRELGTILKKPLEGEFLSNIAQGAAFERSKLDSHTKNLCDEIAWDLKAYDVPLVAYDILDGKITEVNITCPGLIVEVSHAMGVNLAEEIANSF